MKNFVMRSSLALAAMLLAAGAHAETSISAGVTGVSMQTYDLTPNDGFDPFAQVLGGSTVLTSETWFNGIQYSNRSTAQNDGMIRLSVQIGSLYAYGESYGTPLAAPYGNHLYTIDDFGSSLPAGQQVNFRTDSSITITIGANTMIMVGGRFSYYDNLDLATNPYRSGASASAEIGDLSGVSGWSTELSDTGRRDFMVGYANNSNEAINVTMTLRSSLSLVNPALTVAAPVSAVPEPSGYLMFAGGLAMLGALARRRARGTASLSTSRFSA